MAVQNGDTVQFHACENQRIMAGAAPGVFPGIQVNTNIFFNTRQKSYDFSKIMIIFVK
jgi:hypothetical protein